MKLVEQRERLAELLAVNGLLGLTYSRALATRLVGEGVRVIPYDLEDHAAREGVPVEDLEQLAEDHGGWPS